MFSDIPDVHENANATSPSSKGLAGLPIHHALMSPRDILWHFAL